MTAPLDVIAAPQRLPPRPPDSHKGTYGRVLVVAGSRGMSGAAVLCGSAALRGGAGLVQVACPADVQPVVAAGNPCYTTASIAGRADGTFSEACLEQLARLAEPADVLAVGPGLGDREDVGFLVRGLLVRLPNKPVVLDADGLNVLAPLKDDDLPERPGPLVLTPHPGEFARLLGVPTSQVQADRERLAVDFCQRHKLVLVLKGHRTVVTDGQRVYRNDTGNPGMATGGSGDVLTGLIAALVGQGLSAFDAATLGAWTHGRAGDLAAGELGQVALTATDLLDYLPGALSGEQ
ncbi:MAG TPA: NAD(P)H-hydrate dehydratase [Fimbriiglobus sp.]|nr:NAD(P)H-hydrate dehydratase [Fimbriiglobus sp.]